MKRYIVEISKTAEQDLEDIILYLRHSLAGEIIADKYKILFKQKLNIVFYIIDKINSKALVLRIGHAFMDWEKYLRDE